MIQNLKIISKIKTLERHKSSSERKREFASISRREITSRKVTRPFTPSSTIKASVEGGAVASTAGGMSARESLVAATTKTPYRSISTSYSSAHRNTDKHGLLNFSAQYNKWSTNNLSKFKTNASTLDSTNQQTVVHDTKKSFEITKRIKKNQLMSKTHRATSAEMNSGNRNRQILTNGIKEDSVVNREGVKTKKLLNGMLREDKVRCKDVLAFNKRPILSRKTPSKGSSIQERSKSEEGYTSGKGDGVSMINSLSGLLKYDKRTQMRTKMLAMFSSNSIQNAFMPMDFDAYSNPYKTFIPSLLVEKIE